MYPSPNPMPPSRPMPGAMAVPNQVPQRPGDPSLVHAPHVANIDPLISSRFSRGDITSFLGQLSRNAGQAQDMGYIDSVPPWLQNGNLPPGGLNQDSFERLRMWKGRLQDMEPYGGQLPVEPGPVRMQAGGEVKSYADRVREILASREEDLPENPSFEESQGWTVEQWNEWRKRHPRFEPTPTPTPVASLQDGGRAGRDGYDRNAGVAKGGGPNIGFYGGTMGVPTHWYAPSTGQGGLMPGGMRFGPWGGFNPMGASQTELGLYGGSGAGLWGKELYASGGSVQGGSGMTDDVPALLQGSSGPGDPGEFVLNKGAVVNLGLDFLNEQNQRGLEDMGPPPDSPQINVPKMARGGYVTARGDDPRGRGIGSGPGFPAANESTDWNFTDYRGSGLATPGLGGGYWGSHPASGSWSMYPTSWKYEGDHYGWVPHAQAAYGFGGSGARYTTGGGFSPLSGAGVGTPGMGGSLMNSTGDIPRQLQK